jgi:hypothetical protein
LAALCGLCIARSQPTLHDFTPRPLAMFAWAGATLWGQRGLLRRGKAAAVAPARATGAAGATGAIVSAETLLRVSELSVSGLCAASPIYDPLAMARGAADDGDYTDADTETDASDSDAHAATGAISRRRSGRRGARSIGPRAAAASTEEAAAESEAEDAALRRAAGMSVAGAKASHGSTGTSDGSSRDTTAPSAAGLPFVSRFDPSELTMLATAFATLQVPSPATYRRIAEAALPLLPYMSLQHLVSLVWAISEAGQGAYAFPEFTVAAAREVAVRLDIAAFQQMRALLGSPAVPAALSLGSESAINRSQQDRGKSSRTGHSNSQAAVENQAEVAEAEVGVVDDASSGLAERVAASAASAVSGDVRRVLASLLALQEDRRKADPGLYESSAGSVSADAFGENALVRAARSEPMTPRSVAPLLEAFATQNMRSRTVFDAATRYICQIVPACDSQSLASLAWSYSKLQYTGKQGPESKLYEFVWEAMARQTAAWADRSTEIVNEQSRMHSLQSAAGTRQEQRGKQSERTAAGVAGTSGRSGSLHFAAILHASLSEQSGAGASAQSFSWGHTRDMARSVLHHAAALPHTYPVGSLADVLWGGILHGLDEESDAGVHASLQTVFAHVLEVSAMQSIKAAQRVGHGAPIEEWAHYALLQRDPDAVAALLHFDISAYLAANGDASRVLRRGLLGTPTGEKLLALANQIQWQLYGTQSMRLGPHSSSLSQTSQTSQTESWPKIPSLLLSTCRSAFVQWSRGHMSPFRAELHRVLRQTGQTPLDTLVSDAGVAADAFLHAPIATNSVNPRAIFAIDIWGPRMYHKSSELVQQGLLPPGEPCASSPSSHNATDSGEPTVRGSSGNIWYKVQNDAFDDGTTDEVTRRVNESLRLPLQPTLFARYRRRLAEKSQSLVYVPVDWRQWVAAESTEEKCELLHESGVPIPSDFLSY